MKKIIVLAIVILVSNISIAQNKCKKIDPVKHLNTNISSTKLGGNRGYCIYIKGELANKVEQYYNLQPTDSKHIFVIKNVKFKEINNTYKIKLHQGYHGYNKDLGSFYFNTYGKGVHTQKIVNNFNEYEKEGIIIYFYPKKGKKLNKEQVNIIIDFYKALE